MAIDPKNKSSKIIFGLVFIAVVIKLTWWITAQPSTVPPEPPKISGNPAIEQAEESLAAEEEGQTEEPEAVEPAKRIVQVPDNRESNTLTEYEESRYLEISGENLARVATSALEKALDGDMQAATGLPRLRDLCLQNFTDEQWVEEEVQKTMNGLRDGSIPPEGKTFNFTGMEGLGYTAYPTEAENRAHLMQWFHACEHVRALWTEDTRKQLKELARDGHVMARYIYATWLPEWELNSESFSTFTEYQTHALEFSFANLEEGEIAGLVAFGLSYWGRYFTPLFPDLGAAFLKAALDCGLQSAMIEGRVYHKTKDGTVDYSRLIAWYGGDQEAVWEQAEELSKICR